MKLNKEVLGQKLIDGTIHVIAEVGLDKATTRLISIETDTNEAYIYRCFADKEDLFAKTFDFLDTELLTKAMNHVAIMHEKALEPELRARAYFESVWKFLLGNKEKCLVFMQYYYSPYFVKYSYPCHCQRYQPLVEKFSEIFKPDADTWMILNHILNVMLGFAVKVHNGQMPEADDYPEHVFRVVYESVKQYFRD